MKPSEVLLKVPPIRPESSVAGLREMFAHIKPGGHIVEVGCYAGQSTEQFATIAGNLTCVDPWLFDLFPSCPNAITMEDVENAFDVRMAQWKETLRINGGTFEKLKMTSAEAAAKFGEQSVDDVYIDADHWYRSVWNDCKLWLPKIRIGGTIGGHDYNDERWTPEVNRAVDELLGKPDHVFPDCSWLKVVTEELREKVLNTTAPLDEK